MKAPRRSVGDDVLEDLDAAIKAGTMGAVAPAARTYSTPTKLGREMIEGAGQTIARQKDAIERLEAERTAGMVVLRLDPKRIRASGVIEIRLLSPAAAMQRFGGSAKSGAVIAVRTM